MTVKALTAPALRVGAAGLVAASVVVGSIGTQVAASTHSNTSQETTPIGRSWTSWAYDPAQSDVVLFGGNKGPGPWPSQEGTVFGTTWTWQNGCWTREYPASSPAPRQGAAMAYDPATGQLLLFGGSAHWRNPQFYNDTWNWNGTNWTQLNPATSPPPRHQADMVYDAGMNEILLFGGRGPQGYLNDTWAWNGTTWTQLDPATSPSARDTASLVYDPASGTAILYGGFNLSGRLNDTWSWNGTTWTQLSPASSPGVDSPVWQAAYDSASNQLVLYGGDIKDPLHYSKKMWTWTGTTWAQLSPAANPGRRAYGAMTYDQGQQSIVLFGGNNQTRDPRNVWAWNGTNWSLQTCATPHD